MTKWIAPQSKRTVVALVASVSVLALLAACVKREDAYRHSDEQGARLVLTGASAKPTIAVGQTATFRVTVANAGSRDASKVRIVDTVGRHSKLLSITCTGSNNAACPNPLGPEMMADSLPKGAALSFLITVQLADQQPGTILNSMSASIADATDPDLRVLTDSNESTVTNDVMVR